VVSDFLRLQVQNQCLSEAAAWHQETELHGVLAAGQGPKVKLGTGRTAGGGSQTQGEGLLLQYCLLVGQVSLQRGADGSQYDGFDGVHVFPPSKFGLSAIS